MPLQAQSPVAWHGLLFRHRAIFTMARFKAHLAKYSLYHNLILFDTDGKVLAHLDEKAGVTANADPLIEEALGTTAEYVEIYRLKSTLAFLNRKTGLGIRRSSNLTANTMPWAVAHQADTGLTPGLSMVC